MRAFGGGGRGTKGRCRAVGVQPSSVCQCQDSRRRSIPPEARVVSSGVLVRFRYPCPSSGYTNPFFLLHPTRRALLREPSHITCDIGNAPHVLSGSEPEKEFQKDGKYPNVIQIFSSPAYNQITRPPSVFLFTTISVAFFLLFDRKRIKLRFAVPSDVCWICIVPYRWYCICGW